MFTHRICIKMFFFTFCYTTIPLVVPFTVENVRRAQKLLIPTPSCQKMSSKSPCTEITSRNAKYVHIKCIISRLVGSFCMKFRIFLRYSGLKLNLPLSHTFQNLPKMVVPPYQKTFQCITPTISISSIVSRVRTFT
jgi:hypothetical protein